MIRFTICPHTERKGQEIVEVRVHGQLVAVIYPGDNRDDELRIISKYLVGATIDERYPPAVNVLMAIM